MKVVTIDIETTGKDPFNDRLLCVGIGSRVHAAEAGLEAARQLFARPGTIVAAHTNFDLRWLALSGVDLGDIGYHDTKVMAWMLDGTQPLDLASLTERYCGYRPVKALKQRGGRVMFDRMAGSSTGTEELVPIEDAPWDELAAYNRSDLDAEGDLYDALHRALVREGLWHHFLSEEAPFSRLLIEMECAGMPFNSAEGAAKLEAVEADHARRGDWLRMVTGAPGFNLASGDQVARFLYTDLWEQQTRFEIPRMVGISKEAKLEAVRAIAPPGVVVSKVGRDYAYGVVKCDGLGLRPPKRTKKQKTARPSVSGKTLSILYAAHPWVEEYVEWKKLDKLAGYLRDWIAREHEGKLYGRFDQSGTVTGRLAAREPNLQQVATESDIRNLFQGDLVVGDYGGLEVRISAHYSHDPLMMQVFRDGQDLYGTLAARAWGGPATKENEARGLMKVLMLATQYGAGAAQLSVLLALAGLKGYDVTKSKALLADFKATLPRLFEWRQEVIAQATRDGYVTTIGGRRRHLTGLDSANWEKQGKAERQAVNSLVQGSAADIVRRAMLAARRAVDPGVARICLQVHDEIIWARGPEWDADAFPTLVDVCQHAHGFTLDVPLIFEAKVAQAWGEKEGTPGQIHAGAYEHLEESLA